jgi:pyruvate dehydrogenase E2 component (dihydrolipoamide acetyltransferase)
MALHAVTIPKWGLAMEEGQIVHWYVKPGAHVVPGDELVDIETPKITNTVEAELAGTVRRVIASEGDMLPCGQVIAVIDDAQSSEAEVDAFVSVSETEAVAARERSASQKRPEPKLIGKINYLTLGEGEGAPIVFFHGFGGDLNNWLFNQPALSTSHKTYAFDLPGHGASSKDVGEGNVAMLAELLAHAIDALSIDRFHLVGHSLGGAIAATLASAMPGRVASLTLLAPVGVTGDINGTYIEGFVGSKRRRDLQKLLELLFANPSLVTADMAEDILRAKRIDGAEGALQAIAAANFNGSRQAVSIDLAALPMPVTVIWGKEDKIIAPGYSGAVILNEAGHMPHMEKASEVNQLIEKAAKSA